MDFEKKSQFVIALSNQITQKVIMNTFHHIFVLHAFQNHSVVQGPDRRHIIQELVHEKILE